MVPQDQCLKSVGGYGTDWVGYSEANLEGSSVFVRSGVLLFPRKGLEMERELRESVRSGMFWLEEAVMSLIEH